MPVPAPLTPKFVRYFDAPTTVGPAGAPFGMWLRLIYEFWGFCVNGTNDLKHPGGFPTGSSPDVHMSGVINMPVNWESGSNILIHSGSDGTTQDGMPWFTGSNFTQGHVGKWLTVWKSGSTSTDDSIYLITKAFFTGSTGSVIGVDNNMGCTPHPSNLKPMFTERTSVNYRVIDYVPFNQAYTDQHFIVMSVNGAPYVNDKQVPAQIKFRLANKATSPANPRGIAILMSPSGSWNGSNFTDGFTGGNGRQQGTLTNIGEIGPNSGNSFDWYSGGSGTTNTINLIGAQDFLISYMVGHAAAPGNGFHFEIPQRLYPYEYDPNPVCFNNMAAGLYMSNQNDAGYSAFHSYTSDNKPNVHFSSARHQMGDSFNTSIGGTGTAITDYTNGIYNHVWFNVFTNKFSFTDVALGCSVTDQNYLARMRLRRVRFIGPIIPTLQRLGDNGEWLHVNTGILWPWDNAVLPFSIFRKGY